MQSLYKKFNSYAEYVQAKNNGVFNGISYSISTFPENNEVIVYLLNGTKESPKLHYSVNSVSNQPLSYWTSDAGAAIYSSIKK